MVNFPESNSQVSSQPWDDLFDGGMNGTDERRAQRKLKEKVILGLFHPYIS